FLSIDILYAWYCLPEIKDPLLGKPPSYPPWGKIDYALRLRFFLSFIPFCLSVFLPSSREVSVSGLPLTGG
ncbi:MAG: hypothetical protein KIG82_02150, partial [Prevotella sp.]|nr:hypothetical protein [Prevotella sp.]